MKIIPVLLFGLLLGELRCYSQALAIGQWRDHLPYHQTKAIAESPEKIYCATSYAVFSYNKSDQSIERISKASGLSDVGVSFINYHHASGSLIITYNNGNIDLADDGGITNISDIKRSLITAGKNINSITVINNLAYLSCGYGISVLDVSKKEIKETFLIGDNGSYLNVNDIAFDGSNIYAATNSGIYSAALSNPNLSNFNSWKLDTLLPQGSYNQAEFFSGKIYVNFNGPTYESDSCYVLNAGNWSRIPQLTYFDVLKLESIENKIVVTTNWWVLVYDNNWNKIEVVNSYQTPRYIEPKHAILGENNVLWIADNVQGLVKHTGSQTNERIFPNSAFSVYSYQMDIKNNTLAVATGKRARSNGTNWWLNEGIMIFSDETWTNLNYENTAGFNSIFDLITVAIDPSSDKKIFTGSFGMGVVELANSTLTTIYNQSNSSLSPAPPPNQSHVGITGVDFDLQNNLWIVNSNTANGLSVRTQDGKWMAFGVSPIASKQYLGHLLVTKAGHKWIELPNEGIVVFDDNGTVLNPADDKSILLKSGEGQGGLNNLAIMTLAEDLDGKIWVGNEAGIEVFNSPSNVFSGGNFDAQRILVTQDGYTGYLLETEVVISIAVDGANRKWVGTDGAGVFLLSADGTEQLQHFTSENSPLLSNFITCIAINNKSGEVFFGTENGICSYKSDATEGAEEFTDVYAYPNPVKSGYEGPVAIKNLVTDAIVKITDVSGSLVYETRALGGQAIWYSRDFNGNRVRSGVYLAFCSNIDGTLSAITKILVLN